MNGSRGSGGAGADCNSDHGCGGGGGGGFFGGGGGGDAIAGGSGGGGGSGQLVPGSCPGHDAARITSTHKQLRAHPRPAGRRSEQGAPRPSPARRGCDPDPALVWRSQPVRGPGAGPAPRSPLRQLRPRAPGLQRPGVPPPPPGPTGEPREFPDRADPSSCVSGIAQQSTHRRTRDLTRVACARHTADLARRGADPGRPALPREVPVDPDHSRTARRVRPRVRLHRLPVAGPASGGGLLAAGQ